MLLFMRYWNLPRRNAYESLHAQIRMRHSVPVPGNLVHVRSLRRVPTEMFARWVRRPDSAHRLYWRTHKREG